jgi:gliding motility-associated lipoprotein GldH
MHKLKNIFFILTVLIGSLCIGCQPSVLYHKFHSVTFNQWRAKDSLFFTPQLLDSSLSIAHLEIDFNYTTQYPYKHLYLRFLTLNDRNIKIQEDTIKINLIEKNGTWVGNGNAAYRQHKFHFCERTLQYLIRKKFCILPITSKKRKIKGITGIGLVIRK